MLFLFIALAHLVLVGFSLVRMRSRPLSETRTGYAYVPRTTFILGTILKRRKLDDDKDGGGFAD